MACSTISIMKNTKLNLVHFISVLSFLLLILSVSAQNHGTNLTDVAAITLIQSTFPALGRDSKVADPCLPTPYSWVTCNSDDNPRITALNCGNKELHGDLVDFSSMDALEIIDFSGNHLKQEFPDFLAKFPKLKKLNLADNNLVGTVPTSLKNENLELTLKGNRALCFSDDDNCGSAEIIKGTGGRSLLSILKTVTFVIALAICVIILL